MENMVNFWKGKKVLVTGNSGFKGSWLCYWLLLKGAEVFGYSLKTPTEPSLWKLLKIKNDMVHVWDDIRNLTGLRLFVLQSKPDVVFHMAAQSIVKDGVSYPVETFNINTMGTVNLLEACKGLVTGPIIVVTTDKVYDNQWWPWGYREDDTLGASEPYSTSKACAELVVNTYRKYYYDNNQVATVRAGNVLGPGDYQYRVVPMIVDSLLKGESPKIWDPKAIRPWQHVLDCLNGYMTLAERLYTEPYLMADSWNFGPAETEILSVGDLATRMVNTWNKLTGEQIQYSQASCPDSGYPLDVDLRLNPTKAYKELGWKTKWGIDDIVTDICVWNMKLRSGISAEALCKISIQSWGGP